MNDIHRGDVFADTYYFREGLADALTADRHFSQAGFNALLVS